MADKTISQLPQLPGNLTLDTILAVVQNGVAHKAEVGEVVDFTLGNIKVVENGDAVSVRFPESRIQVCFLKGSGVAVQTHTRLHSSDFWRSSTVSFTFPQAFASTPLFIPTARSEHATRMSWASGRQLTRTEGNMLAVNDERDENVYCSYIAIGFY